MRPVLPEDLDRCARSLMQVPQQARASRMEAILRGADVADRYRKRTGRLHPRLGDGSLGELAGREGLAPRPPRCDASYCEALAEVLDALAQWRARARHQDA